MFGSSILEVAIGLVLVYLLLSLICTAVQETMEAWLKIRASNLEKGLRELLHDPSGSKLVTDLYNHPLIFSLFQGPYEPTKVRSSTFTTNLPSYIPAANFAAALMDTILRGTVPNSTGNDPSTAKQLTFASLRDAVSNSTTLDTPVQRVLLISLDAAEGDLAKAQANIEAWFNNGMDRVSGWYKRRIQAVLLGLGLLVAVLLNVDSLRVASALYQNDALRAGAVAQAGVIANNGTMAANLSTAAMSTLKELKLPIGWQQENLNDTTNKEASPVVVTTIFRVFGWLITGFAISFGAPFWFDLLNKLTVIRSTIKPLEKIVKVGAEERPQPSPPSAVKSPAAPVPTAPDFKSHEWAKNINPQEGVL